MSAQDNITFNGTLTQTKRHLYRQAQQFAGLALAVAAIMASFKIFVGLLSGSRALLASALYSFNDLLSSISIAISLRFSRKPASEESPYGHGKAEFIAIGIVSLTIAIAVFFMFFFSVLDVLKGVPGPPHFIAMSLAALGMVISWNTGRKAHHLGEKLRSPALMASAAHHHADAEGSLLAIIGIATAIFGLHIVDRVVAVFETLHLIALSGTLLGKALKGLMDSAMPAEDVMLIEEACAGIEGLDRITRIRSRQAGSQTCVDVAVLVPKNMTVAMAHAVCEKVQTAVRGVIGVTGMTQVRFQSPDFVESLPRGGGSSA